MKWDNVRYFLALTSERSLSAAARQLDVSHATVARRVEELEEVIGGALFTKTPNGYEPTLLAEQLMEPAAEVERQMQRFARIGQAWDNEPAGVVRLAIAGFLGPIVGIPAAARLRQVHPRIVLDVMEGQRQLNLQRQEADLALRVLLRGQLDAPPSLRVRRLGTLHWSIWASTALAKAHAIEGYPERFDHLPLVGYDACAPAQPGHHWLQERTDSLSFSVFANSLTSVEAAVAQGLGAGALPNFIARKHGFVKLSETVMSFDIFLVIHPDMERNLPVRTVADFLCEYVAGRDDLFG
jgi:DNA-binding transcriptional LysR family regulator